MASPAAAPTRLAGLATLGSAALLLGALGFQFIGGLAPCTLCIWQRWPHLAAIGAGALRLKIASGWISVNGAIGSATSAAIGIFHTGVERGFWKGLSSCSGGRDISGLTPAEALEAIMTAPIVKCDEVAWQMMGLSMASWNAVISLVIAALWVLQARRDFSRKA